MNDELITAVREQRNKVRMDTPVEQIIGRGRAMRARRRIPGMAGALAVAAVAAFAVTALLPASHQSGQRPSAQLAAWTVTRQADGTVYVTIRELRDPAGLQSKLRADGIPASVIFGNPPNAQPNPCQSYGGGPELLQNVFTLLAPPGPPQGHSTAMAIHPSALPDGVGVQVISSQSSVGAHLVTTSQGCTGS
jgi:hypothetical protein